MNTAKTNAKRKTKINWILVDIGDVLLIKNNPWTNFSQLLAQELGIDAELAQQINRAHYSTMDVKYISEKEFVDSLKINLNYDAPDNIFNYFSKAYEKQAHPNTPLFSFLEEIREVGMKTAILSNTIAIYQKNHEQMGINEQNGFDPIIYSWREEMKKPDERFFKLAISKLNAEPSEVIFIDDKLKNIRAANRIGMNGVLFDIEHTEKAVRRVSNIIKKNNGK